MLLQLSTAVMVKTCVIKQPSILVATAALTIAGVLLQLSVAVTVVKMLFVVGILAGLQP